MPAAPEPRPGAEGDRGLPPVSRRADRRSSTPRVIVTLGNFATKLLLETTKGIRELRGQVFERGRASLVPTYHPAYVLRAGGEAMAEMRADLVRAKRLMAAGRP